MISALDVYVDPEANLVHNLSKISGGSISDRTITYTNGLLAFGAIPHMRIRDEETRRLRPSMIAAAQILVYPEYFDLVLPQISGQDKINIITAKDRTLNSKILQPKDLTGDQALAVEFANLEKEERSRRRMDES